MPVSVLSSSTERDSRLHCLMLERLRHFSFSASPPSGVCPSVESHKIRSVSGISARSPVSKFAYSIAHADTPFLLYLRARLSGSLGHPSFPRDADAIASLSHQIQQLHPFLCLFPFICSQRWRFLSLVTVGYEVLKVCFGWLGFPPEKGSHSIALASLEPRLELRDPPASAS